MGDDDLGSPKKKVCVVWDEDNLITNEGIKADLNCQKIDEPDTPFVRSPLRETDSSDDEQDPPAALLIEDPNAKEKLIQSQNGTGARFAEDASTSGSPAAAKPKSAMRADAKFAGTAGDGTGSSGKHTDALLDMGAGVPLDDEAVDLEAARQKILRDRRMSNGEPCDLPQEIMTSDLPKMMSHAMMDAKRKQHYNMRDALRRGRELIEEEDEEDNEGGAM